VACQLSLLLVALSEVVDGVSWVFLLHSEGVVLKVDLSLELELTGVVFALALDFAA